MKAIIMAGGGGTRLRPLTCTRPKPMMPLLGRPVMEYIIAHLREQGITDIGATLHYMPSAISDYFKDGTSFGVSMKYFVETIPMGTAGSIKNAEDFLDEDFIVISGDAMCDIDLKEAAAHHYEKNADVTIVLSRVKNPLEYGAALTEDDGRIFRFIEKPSWKKALSDQVNTGIYIINRRVLDLIPQNEVFDFSKDLFPLMLSEGRALYGFTSKGYWCDIGDCSAYLSCNFDMLDGKVNSPIISKMRIEGEILPIDYGPCFISKSCLIDESAEIKPYSIIEEGCVVAKRTKVEKSILHKGAHLFPNSEVRGSIIGRKTAVLNGSSCLDGSVIGDNVIIGEGAYVLPDVKIWPYKNIEALERISDNVVLGSGANLKFCDGCLSGLYNIDVTSRFCARLGGAIAGVFKKQSTVLIGCDGSPASLGLADGIMSGITSAGQNVVTLNSSGKGEIAYYTRRHDAHCGIYIFANKDMVNIFLYDHRGLPISSQLERRLEGLLYRDEFPRPRPRDAGVKSTLRNHDQEYITGLIDVLGGTFSAVLSLKRAGTSPDFDRIATALLSAGCTLLPPSSKEAEEVPTIIVHGDSLVLEDEERRITAGERLSLLLAALYSKLHPTHSIPLLCWMPYASEEFLSSLGVKGMRCTSDYEGIDGESAVAASLLCDPVFGALLIAKGLSMGISSAKAASSLPNFSIFKKEVSCKSDGKARILSHFQEGTPSPEGALIEKDNAHILIIPHPARSSFRIFVESSKMETAKELCNYYEKKITDLSENNKM